MAVELELADIQGTVLRNRPMPYFGSYLVFRIDDAVAAGTMLARLLPHVTSAANWQAPPDEAWISVVFTCEGLRRMGVDPAILAGFPLEFQQGMAARSAYLGDVGQSDPALWDLPHAGTGFHIGLMVMAGSRAGSDAMIRLGREVLTSMPGVSHLARLDVGVPPTLREHFGYADGISRPFIEGEGGVPLPGQGAPVKAGEFVLGYENALGQLARAAGPAVLWRNGTFVAIRKIRQHVHAFRSYLQAQAGSHQEQELLAAKMMGRWRSGCPLALRPEQDDPALAADRQRNNDFAYADDDPAGLKTPVGSHIRRVNPRDALRESVVDAGLHRLLRRGAAYGPALPEDAPGEDGADRGIVLALINANPGRQFEFVQAQWVNDGDFVSQAARSDPIVGRRDRADDYVFPARPVRRHLTGLREFTATRGGEHVFMPGLAGLRWLAGLAAGMT